MMMWMRPMRFTHTNQVVETRTNSLEKLNMWFEQISSEGEQIVLAYLADNLLFTNKRIIAHRFDKDGWDDDEKDYWYEGVFDSVPYKSIVKFEIDVDGVLKVFLAHRQEPESYKFFTCYRSSTEEILKVQRVLAQFVL